MTEPVGLDVLGRLLPSLALIVGALLLLRRWSRRGGVARGAGGVRVLARTGLTRGAVLAVVAVGGRRFLVGATDHGVALLGELDRAGLDEHGFEGSGVEGPQEAMRATDGRAPATNRPRMGLGLVDRLRAMTIRTHLQGPVRAPSR